MSLYNNNNNYTVLKKNYYEYVNIRMHKQLKFTIHNTYNDLN